MKAIREYLIAIKDFLSEPIFVILFTFIIAYLATKFLRFVMNQYLEKASITKSVDPTRYRFFNNALNLIMIVVALIVIFMIIPQLKALGLTLFASAGIFAAILGIASQQALSNISSGIFIVIFRPFRVGDFIRFGQDKLGIVEDITLRHSVIRSFENRRVIIPNSVISAETIINSSIIDEKTCIFIEIGLALDCDLEKAISIIRIECIKHPSCIDNRTDEEIALNVPQVEIRVLSFGEYTINVRAYAWAVDPITGFEMKCDILRTLHKQFKLNDIEIPTPYRTIQYKSDLAINKPDEEKSKA